MHAVLTAIFPAEPRLAGCRLNFPSLKPKLRILLGQA